MQDAEVVWPPTVILCNTFLKEQAPGNWSSLGKQQLPTKLLMLMDGKAKYRPIYNKYGHRGMSFVVFGGDEDGEGFRDAEEMADSFFLQGKGLYEWERLIGGRHGDEAWCQPFKQGIEHIYGYMARKVDMERLDPRKQFCKSWRMRALEEVKKGVKRRQREGNDKTESKLRKLEQDKDEVLQLIEKREQERKEVEEERAKAIESLEKRAEKHRTESALLRERISKISAEQQAAESEYEARVQSLNTRVQQIDEATRLAAKKFRRQVEKAQAARQEELRKQEEELKSKDKKQNMLQHEFMKIQTRNFNLFLKEKNAELLEKVKEVARLKAQKMEELDKLREEATKTMEEMHAKYRADMQEVDAADDQLMNQVNANENNENDEAAGICAVCHCPFAESGWRAVLPDCKHATTCYDCWEEHAAYLRNKNANDMKKPGGKQTAVFCPSCMTPVKGDVIKIPWKIYF
ncbi:hypothetical protein CBR_g4468 [Chara braunii]|uniref:RING-type domain-containing protein n=1 Tax=Chara braunii TaxID=69332 RepID=A0A388KHW8_CHABU|nr:hypothetical protein CBR_g4468 [Chara braunii]|eukprot:GBG69639.1 hypothetical protein CBR_g4468 [Chara braunii]